MSSSSSRSDPPKWFSFVVRRGAIISVLLAGAWAAIYLPALGAIELKGEEGRRAMPGLQMLDDHDWLVPKIGGREYNRKPPLVNWVVAGTAKVLDRRDEWAIRLPSALATLALVLGAFFFLRAPLGEPGALCAAVFILTNVGLMELGRKIEIEALYISLSGLAILSWIHFWWRADERGVGWFGWTVSGLLLGLGLLAKGPVNLLFFYAVVTAVLVAEGRTRTLLRPTHFFGILLAAGIFGAWAYAIFLRLPANAVAGEWMEQITERVSGTSHPFELGRYLRNVSIQGWVNFVPWIVLVAVAWPRSVIASLDPRRIVLHRGLRWAIGISYFAIMLLPAAAPRYVLPLLVPASVLAALLFDPVASPAVMRTWAVILRGFEILIALAVPAALGFMLLRWRTFHPGPALLEGTWVGSILVGILAFLAFEILRRGSHFTGAADLALRSAGVMAVSSVIFAAVVPPQMAPHERLRPLATQIEKAVPRAEFIYAFDPDSQPAFFYLRRNPVFVLSADRIPDSARYLFIPEEFLPRLVEGGKWGVARELLRYVDRGQRVLLVVEIKRAAGR